MCYGDDARVPLPPIRGAAGDWADFRLTSADGASVAAAYAHPEQGSDVGMIVMPDVRGLHSFYKELAMRFAEAGIHACAIDYFARTADTDERDEGFEFRSHVEQMRPEQVDADVGAAAGWLRSEEGGGCRSLFTVGFCMGGGLSWAQSAAGHGLAGCIGFYGIPSRVESRVPDMQAPLLLLAAGRDFTPVEETEKFAARVREAGVEAELHVYPEAPHSFFDRSYDQYAGECDDAWRRILDFVERHSG